MPHIATTEAIKTAQSGAPDNVANPGLLAARLAAELVNQTGEIKRLLAGITKPIRYVFEGDSIFTPDWLTTAVPYLFAKQQGMSQSCIVNYAVSGQTVATMVTQYAAEAGSIAPSVTGIPAWFILDGGINDIAGGATAAAIYNNLKILWAAARASGYLVCAYTLHGWTTNATHVGITTTLNTLILSDPSLYDACCQGDLVLFQYRADLYVDSVHGNAIGRAMLATAIGDAIRGKKTSSELTVRVSKVASQVITSAVALIFGTVNEDAWGTWSGSNLFRAPVTGLYRISGACTFTTGTVANKQYVSMLKVNGADYHKQNQIGGISLTSGVVTLAADAVIPLTKGDSLQWFADTDGTLTSAGGGGAANEAVNGRLSIVLLKSPEIPGKL